jgi:hypothetical protein
MDRIDSLTDAQRARFAEWRDKWIAIGLSTEPANFEAAEAGVRGCYRAAGLEPPPITRVGSPLVAVIAGPIAEMILMGKGNSVWESVRKSVWKSVENSVQESVENSVGESVWESVREAVSESVGESVWESVWESVREAVSESVRKSVWKSVRKLVQESVGESVVESVVESVGESVWESVREAVSESVRKSVWKSVWKSVRDSVVESVRKLVRESVRKSVRKSVWESVRELVENSVGELVENSVGESVHEAVRGSWYFYRGGAWWAGWHAYVSFFRDICGWEHESLVAFAHDEQHALNAGWCWQGVHCAMLSDRPSAIHLRDNRLHCETGPAIAFRDGWALWFLHGVRVPEWLVETKDTDLDPARIMEITNVEVRREFVRKIGMERLWHKLNPKILETRKCPIGGTYTLADLHVGEGRLWRVLRMENPSVPEVWHIEGVPNDRETVYAALNFRNNLPESQIDDERGADWYQQGDVIFRPYKAKKFKRFPKILT